MERPGRAEIAGYHLIRGPSKGFLRDFVMGYGKSSHGFTHD
jgi:hypothetical protein